jgi:hypothetical protein
MHSAFIERCCCLRKLTKIASGQHSLRVYRFQLTNNSVNGTMTMYGIFELKLIHLSVVSRDSAVGIATGYGLDDIEVGVRVPVGSRIFTSPCRPDRLCGPPNLLYKGYRGLFPGGKAAGA